MKIAVYHNLPSGGGKRALFEMTRRLAEQHTVDVYTLSTAEHEFCDLRPSVARHEIWPFQPLPLARRPFGRLNQGIRSADLRRLETFCDLVRGDQPRGYGGEARLVNIESNGAEMLHRLDALFASADPPVLALKGPAYGNAYLSLAMLSDQAGDWSAARRYIRQAVRAYPALLRDRSIIRRLLKLSLGRGLVGQLRSRHRIEGAKL